MVKVGKPKESEESHTIRSAFTLTSLYFYTKSGHFIIQLLVIFMPLPETFAKQQSLCCSFLAGSIGLSEEAPENPIC